MERITDPGRGEGGGGLQTILVKEREDGGRASDKPGDFGVGGGGAEGWRRDEGGARGKNGGL